MLGAPRHTRQPQPRKWKDKGRREGGRSEDGHQLKPQGRTEEQA